MEDRWLAFYIAAFLIVDPDSKLAGEAFQPEFAEPLMDLTVPLGREATFRCLVQNLGGYRVGWVKADTKAIQAIHVHVITNNHRVSVSHNGQTVWNLHIKNVQEEDRGQYMCQINTDPMKSQVASLEVVIPPDFISEETSSDTMVQEGGMAKVHCKAKGNPTPKIQWKREDGGEIVMRDANGIKNRVAVLDGETLTISKISRSDMGAYLCIASNGVPPSVSKRIMIVVHFAPVIQVPNQLVGAPLGTDVTLDCYVESSPKAINYWSKDSSEIVISSSKFKVANTAVSLFENRMALTVHCLTKKDLGTYRCVSKNSLGESDSSIRLYEIPGESLDNSVAVYTEEDRYSTNIDNLTIQESSSEYSEQNYDDYQNPFQTKQEQPIDNKTKHKSRNQNTINPVKQKASNRINKEGETQTKEYSYNDSTRAFHSICLVSVCVSLTLRLFLFARELTD